MSKSWFSKVTAAMLTVAMVAALFMVPAIPARCATAKLTDLKPDKVYTTLDVTGDGKADRFKIQRPKWTGPSRPNYKSFTISVNGKKAYQFKTSNGDGYFNLNPTLITLQNGKKFLFITCGNGDTYISMLTAVFQYKGGKFVKVVDFNQYCKAHCYSWYVWPKTVNGNKVDFDVSMYSPTSSKGYFNGDLTMQFVYQSGSLKQNSAAARVNKDCGRIRVGKKVWAYTTPARTKNAFKLLAGNVVGVDQCRISSTRLLLRVKKGSKYGWILLGNGVTAQAIYSY